MRQRMQKTKADLADLGSLAAKTETAEQRILAAAEKRIAAVTAQLDKMRPGIEAQPEDAQQRYQDLVTEKGQLQVVIGRAQRALAHQ